MTAQAAGRPQASPKLDAPPFALNFQRLVETIDASGVSRSALADRFAITSRDLARDILLNGGAYSSLLSNAQFVEFNVASSFSRLLERRRRVRGEYLAARSIYDLRDTIVLELDASTSNSLLCGLHYLGSPREAERHFALFGHSKSPSAQNLLALASISSFDLMNLIPSIVPLRLAKGTRVLSRLLSLRGAPKNSLSRLIGTVSRMLRSCGTAMLLTYNNPNLGFVGSIYRATNWRLAGYEKKLPDYQIDDAYVPRREIRRLYGTDDIQALKTRLSTRIHELPIAELPLEIYVLDMTAQSGLKA